MHLFDLEAERELDIDFVLGEDDVLGVFEVPTGYEIVVRSDDGSPSGELLRVVHVGHDGRATGASDEPLALSTYPLVRLDDGRYVGAAPYEGLTSPMGASLELASASGSVERIDLGFETMSGHLADLRWTGDTLVGIGYEDEATRVVRFEVDLDAATVRLATLVEGVRLSALGDTRFALEVSGGTATVALSYELAADPPGSNQTVELFWWPIGADSVTRNVVRPSSELWASILALGGEMPRQTLVLAQTSSSRTWVTAARIRGPGEVVGGSEPLGVFPVVTAAAAWEPPDGTAALAFLSQHEVEVLYFCEGAP